MISLLKSKKLLVFFDQAIVSGSNFLLSVLLARNLEIKIFGEFSLLWLVLLFFLGIQNAAIISPFYSLEPKRSGEEHRRLGDVFGLQLIYSSLAILLTLIFIVIASFFNEDWDIKDGLLPFSLFFVAFLIQDFLRRLFFLNNKYIHVIIIDVLAYVVSLVLLYLNLNILDSLELVYCLLFSAFFSSLIVALLFLRKSGLRIYNLQFTFKEYWSFSKWLSLSAILQWFSGNWFIVIGAMILGPWVAGVIRVFQNTMGVFNVLFLGLENFVPISASNIYSAHGYKKMISYIKNFAFKGLLPFLGFGVLLLIFSPEKAISFIYGDDYNVYANLIYWYLLIYIFIYFGLLFRFIIRTVEKTQNIFLVYLASTILSLIFSWPLVKYFGIYGIAGGTLGTQILMFTLYYKIGNEGTAFCK